MIEVVCSSRVSLLAFYFDSEKVLRRTNGSLTEEIDKAGSAKGLKSGHVKKYLLTTEYKRVLIQPGERLPKQLTNKSKMHNQNTRLFENVQNFLFLTSKEMNGSSRRSNIGCSESKVIFK